MALAAKGSGVLLQHLLHRLDARKQAEAIKALPNIRKSLLKAWQCAGNGEWLRVSLGHGVALLF
jgi:hypothetical protein